MGDDELSPPASPAPRPALRAVALPSEHGGWGLTAEPIVLGLLTAPSIAGFFLGLAAMLAFIAHTPLRVVLVDRHRDRELPRTALARRVLRGELAAIAALGSAAALLTSDTFWWPALIAAPLLAVSLWFDTRSRSRRLAPELAGTIGIASVAAMIVLAGGGDVTIAVAAWLILAARAVTSIPHVRSQIAALHDRPEQPRVLLAADAAAAATTIAGVLVTVSALAGAISVAAVIAIQRFTSSRHDAAKVIGIRQMVLGLVVVVATAAGLNSVI